MFQDELSSSGKLLFFTFHFSFFTQNNPLRLEITAGCQLIQQKGPRFATQPFRLVSHRCGATLTPHRLKGSLRCVAANSFGSAEFFPLFLHAYYN